MSFWRASPREPTAGTDVKFPVSAFAEAMGSLNSVLSNRNMQLIVSSHHDALAAYADRVIDVTTLNQPYTEALMEELLEPPKE
jgi:hypothetical protein